MTFPIDLERIKAIPTATGPGPRHRFLVEEGPEGVRHELVVTGDRPVDRLLRFLRSWPK